MKTWILGLIVICCGQLLGCSTIPRIRILPNHLPTILIGNKINSSCRIKVNPFVFEDKRISGVLVVDLETSFSRLLNDEIESKSLCKLDNADPNYVMSGAVKVIEQWSKSTSTSKALSIIGGIAMCIGIPYTVLAYINNGQTKNKVASVSLLSSGVVMALSGGAFPKSTETHLEVLVEVVGKKEKKIVWKKKFIMHKSGLGQGLEIGKQDIRQLYDSTVESIVRIMNRRIVKTKNKTNALDKKKLPNQKE